MGGMWSSTTLLTTYIPPQMAAARNKQNAPATGRMRGAHALSPDRCATTRRTAPAFGRTGVIVRSLMR